MAGLLRVGVPYLLIRLRVDIGAQTARRALLIDVLHSMAPPSNGRKAVDGRDPRKFCPLAMRTLEQLREAAAGARAAAGPDAEAGEDAVLSSLQAWFHADSVDAYMEVRHNANF